MFACAVNSLVRGWHETHDRSDVDDSSGPLPPHEWEHGLGHPQDTKKVGLKELLRFFYGCFFERANQRVTGVVHQRINSARPVHYRPHTRPNRVIIANIEQDQVHFLQGSLRLNFSSCSSKYSKPYLGEQAENGPSDSRRDSRDYCYFFLTHVPTSLISSAVSETLFLSFSLLPIHVIHIRLVRRGFRNRRVAIDAAAIGNVQWRRIFRRSGGVQCRASVQVGRGYRFQNTPIGPGLVVV